MQTVNVTSGPKAEINVTPLVDVVLVLLIIFMIVAPQMVSGPDVALPTTDQPVEATDDEQRIIVGISRGGKLWIDDEEITADRFRQRMVELAESRSDWKVVIKGDARLKYGEVRQAMVAVESAGFKRVGLITKKAEQG